MSHRQFFAFSYSLMAREAGGRIELEKFFTDYTSEFPDPVAAAATNPAWIESEEGRKHQLGLMKIAEPAKRRGQMN